MTANRRKSTSPTVPLAIVRAMAEQAPGSGGSGDDSNRVPPDQDAQATVEPAFLTLDDVARYLNVSVPQVYALVRSRELPAIKIGGRGVWRVGKQQLLEYVDRLHRETLEWAKAHPLNSRDQP